MEMKNYEIDWVVLADEEYRVWETLFDKALKADESSKMIECIFHLKKEVDAADMLNSGMERYITNGKTYHETGISNELNEEDVIKAEEDGVFEVLRFIYDRGKFELSQIIVEKIKKEKRYREHEIEAKIELSTTFKVLVELDENGDPIDDIDDILEDYKQAIFERMNDEADEDNIEYRYEYDEEIDRDEAESGVNWDKYINGDDIDFDEEN